jgi:hypothetical protein
MLCASSRRIRRQAIEILQLLDKGGVMQLFTLLSWPGQFQALDGRQNRKQEISKSVLISLAKSWLGREDSNLRMVESKSAGSPMISTGFLTKQQILPRDKSIG